MDEQIPMQLDEPRLGAGQASAVASPSHHSAVELMTMLAHDLRNYMTPVRGCLAMLERRAQHEQREQGMRSGPWHLARRVTADLRAICVRPWIEGAWPGALPGAGHRHGAWWEAHGAILIECRHVLRARAPTLLVLHPTSWVGYWGGPQA